MGWLGPMRDTRILPYPKSCVVFPSFASHCFPSGKLVRVAVGRSLGSSLGPPSALPAAPVGLAAGGFPLKAPSCATRCVQGQGGLFGEERCALLQGPWAGGTCSPWFWDVIAIPMTCGVILNPQLLASWECGRIPLLFFFFLPSLILSCFQPSLRQAQKFDS